MSSRNYLSNDYAYPPVTNVSQFERYATIITGGFLIYCALKNFGRKPLQSLSRAAAGSALLYRGATGYCPIYEKLDIDGRKTASINTRVSIIVNKPREDVYNFWRNLANLPLFMKHIEKVEEYDGRKSRWEARIPEGSPVPIKWEAEIVKDVPGELLSWQSLPGSGIDNAGKIEFHDALGKQGTELRVMITYRPPAGNIGAGIAKLLNPVFAKIVHDDIMNFKSFLDAGKINLTDLS